MFCYSITRNQGFAKAVSDAFDDDAKIVTVRAIDAAAGKLYQSLGFKAYNYAI